MQADRFNDIPKKPVLAEQIDAIEHFSIEGMQRLSYQNSRAKGFYDDPNSLSTLGILSRLALIHSEASEGTEEVRKGRPNFYLVEGKPEGLGPELADVVIRCGDLATALGIDLNYCIKQKMRYNCSRPPMHGKKA